VEAEPEMLRKLKIYACLAPHIEVAGWGNNGHVIQAIDRELLVAERNGMCLAMMATHPFSRLSVGYVGQSDGWTDLANGFQMDWDFDSATDGNIALFGEIDLSKTQDFTLGIAFGNGRHRTMTTLFQSLLVPFDKQLERFEEQWKRSEHSRRPLERQSCDGGELYRASHRLLLAHEDKTYQGAMVASVAIPWGEAKNDEQGEAGYHLVWTRDMVQSALGLLASGNTETPFRALIYLATSQQPDGSFAQNFWLSGEPFWSGIQLDEVCFPILLAHRLQAEGVLKNLDPYPMILRGAGFLVRTGPVSQQERWEELGGYSPSTIAVQIAALLCAADFARQRGETETAVFLEQYADWMEHNLETWTVTRVGSLLEGTPEYYVRVNPASSGDYLPENGVTDEMVTLSSRYPGERAAHPAKDIVDGGFLELVRYGVRRADHPIILNTLKVVDANLGVDLPGGRCWRRYNHDGGPYEGFGRGRAWPLLTGERGHYEIAAGRDASDQIRWMEGLATPTKLLPEQVWDQEDLPDAHMSKGKPTGSATPLLWAHAEYIKLLRSREDGKAFDLIACVANRYLGERIPYANLHFWSILNPARSVKRGQTLRILALAAFRVHWSTDEWHTANDQESSNTKMGVCYADLEIAQESDGSRAPIHFTFWWNDSGKWEGKDFHVEVV
jgi:glucoamylase